MPFLTLSALSKSYPSRCGPPAPVMDSVSLTLDRGEFLAVLGPSGCGKSTLLQMIAGLLPATSGTVTLDNRPTRTIPPVAKNPSPSSPPVPPGWRR